MKKTRAFPSTLVFSGILFLAISFVALVWGCQKEKSSDEPAITPEQSITSDIGGELGFRSGDTLYPDNILNTAAVGLLQLSKNSTFRQLVNTEVAKKFDDDDNVLLKTVASKAQSDLNLNLETEFSNSINYHTGHITVTSNPLQSYYQTLSIYTDATEVHNSIFSYVDDGETLYPQIYIPYIDQVNLNSQPVIAILTFSETESVGYRLRTDGYFDVIRIDEAFAQNNLVWVISPNESVGNDGTLPETGDCCNRNGIQDGQETGVDCGGPCCVPCQSAFPPSACFPFKHAQLTKIKIDDNHEGGLAGKGEITWFGYQFDRNCNFEMIGLRGAPAAGDGAFCSQWPNYWAKLKNSDEGQWFTLSSSNGAHFKYMTFGWDWQWPNESCGEWANTPGNSYATTRICGQDEEGYKIVVFERDHAHPRTTTFTAGECSKTVKWKSRDNAYLIISFPYSDIPQGINCTPPPNATCNWVETQYNGDDGDIKITTKEQFQ